MRDQDICVWITMFLDFLFLLSYRFFVQDFSGFCGCVSQCNKKILHLLTNDSSPTPLDLYSCNNTAAVKIFALISLVVVTSFPMKGIRV